MSHITITDNALEQARFGMKSAKISGLDRQNISTLKGLLQAHDGVFYSVRISTDEIQLAQDLETLGFKIMDTLVYYRKSNLKHTPLAESAFICKIGTADDAPALLEMARRSFKGYVGHYHADRKLPADLCDEVYAEWAYNSCLSKDKSTQVLIAFDEAKPVGFAVMKAYENYSDGVLFAVDPNYQGQGIYRQLIKQSLNWTVDRGLSAMIYSSQINNNAVHKIWAQEGAEIYQSFYTFHLWKN